MSEAKRRTFRECIVHVLKHMRHEIGQFEQTCQGRIVLPGGVREFGRALEEAWNNPNGLNVSHLKHAIDAVAEDLEREKADAP
jgi:hypothetical protein